MMQLRFLLRAVVATFTGIIIVLIVLVLQSDPQGEENADCMHAAKFLVLGPDGMSASGHVTICSPPAASIGTYVYLHPSNVLPTSKNLVFRYSQTATVEPPKIHWADGQHLTVEATHVEAVSKQEVKFAKVKIEYKIAAENPRGEP